MTRLNLILLMATVLSFSFTFHNTFGQVRTVIGGSTPQTIAFANISAKMYPGSFVLTATASSGLPVSYESSNPEVASIDGSTVTLHSPGSVSIIARQFGDLTYAAATPVERNLTIGLGAPAVVASGIEFSEITSNSMTVSFTPGNGNKRLVVVRANASVSLVPAKNIYYNVGYQNSYGNKVVSNGTETSVNLTGLAANVNYYVRIYEYNHIGDLITYKTSPPASAIQRSGSLAWVVTPTHEATGQKGTVAVTSLTVAGATSYTIELNTSPSFEGTSIVKTGGRTITFTGLAYNQTYYSRVRSSVNSEWGATRSFSTGTAESISYVVTPLSGASNIPVTQTVVANLVPGATSYSIELNTSPLFNGTSIVKTGASRSQTFTGLSYNTAYFSRVRTNYTDTWGETRGFTTINALDASYVVSPANNAINQVWILDVIANPISGATSYTIQLSTNPEFEGYVEKTGTSRKQNFTGLAYNTLYYSRVSTNLTPGDFGPTKTFTTTNPLARSYVTSPANNAINVNTTVRVFSNSVPGASFYAIELNTASDFSGIPIMQMANRRDIVFTGLMPGTTYYTRVFTDLGAPFEWGATKHFTTIGAGRISTHTDGAEGEEGTPEEFEVDVVNNPFKNKLSFIVKSPFQGEAVVKLMDLNGRAVHQETTLTNTTVDIERPGNTGVFILQVKTREHYKSVRVVQVE